MKSKEKETALEYVFRLIDTYGLESVNRETMLRFEKIILNQCWVSAQQEMRNTFSNDFYKEKTFEQYYSEKHLND